jgi:DNA-binding protein YbaB
VREITGDATLRGVTVSVHPGGALASLSLSREALAQDPSALASAVLDAVATATTEANDRTRKALALAGADLSVLGPVEEPDFTVPETWRVS